MFKALKKKTYILIGSFLLLSMAVTFIIVYYTYSSLLFKDFMRKQTFLAAQTTRAFKDQLLFLDEQTHLYINKNQLYDKLENKNYSALSTLNFDSIDFLQLDIYSSDKLVSSIKNMASPYNLDSLPVSKVINHIEENNDIWYIYEADKSSEQVLTCVKPIIENAETAGYVVFWISPNTLLNVLSVKNSYMAEKETMFSNYTSAALCIEDKIYACGKTPPSKFYDEPLEERAKTFNATIHGRTYTFYSEIELQDMYLFLEGDMTIYESYFSVIKRTLLISYALISLLIIGSLYLFNRETSSVINKLYDKLMLNDTRRT